MMAGVTRSVRVSIAGQTFSVRTDASPRYVRELASFVDRRIADAKDAGRAVTTQSLALLAALSIADELHQARDSRTKLKRRVRETSENILRVLDAESSLATALRDEGTERGESHGDLGAAELAPAEPEASEPAPSELVIDDIDRPS
jgi:cell division protein ZapA